MADTLSRRTFLQFTAAGSVAALPVAAAVSYPNIDTIPISDQQMLDACIGQLKNILQRMHPTAGPASHYVGSERDGGFYLTLRAEPAYEDFDGDGFYLVSVAGDPALFWLQEAFLRTQSGKVVDRHWWGYEWLDHNYSGDGSFFNEPRYMGQPKIIRKLSMPLGMTRDDVPFDLARY